MKCAAVLMLAPLVMGYRECVLECRSFLTGWPIEEGWNEGSKGCDWCSCNKGTLTCKTMPEGQLGCTTKNPCLTPLPDVPQCGRNPMCSARKECADGRTCLREFADAHSLGCCVGGSDLKVEAVCKSPVIERSRDCPAGSGCLETRGNPGKYKCKVDVCQGRLTCGNDPIGRERFQEPEDEQCEAGEICLGNAACAGGACKGCCSPNPCLAATCGGGACVVTPDGTALCMKGCRTRCGRQVPHQFFGRDDGDNACNRCSCTDGVYTCQKRACNITSSCECTEDADCSAGAYCAAAPSATGCSPSKECVPFAGVAHACDGPSKCGSPPRCDPSLVCVKSSNLANATGTCTEV
ncbi:hypothetical protein DIPPA_05369 [Diplonema papillatum]|nr:hypothetical protein DIPPA_05369 [Diplonema papillatum]